MGTYVAEFEPSSDGKHVKWQVRDRDEEFSYLDSHYGWTRTMWGAKRQVARTMRRINRVKNRREKLWKQIDAEVGTVIL